MSFFRRSFPWARLRDNSCARQLRVFCFPGSSPNTMGPFHKAAARLGSSIHSALGCPKEMGQKKENHIGHYATEPKCLYCSSFVPMNSTRQSHFAFAISRAVKRQVFEWANRECGPNGVMNHGNGELLSALTVEEPFERYALLRHFLHRCVTKGLLSDSELDLLIQFKLDGNNGEELGKSNGTSSNAVRQRLKRLLTKLRRLPFGTRMRHCLRMWESRSRLRRRNLATRILQRLSICTPM